MDVAVHTASAELYGGLSVVVRSASAELQVCYGCNRSERLGRDAVWYGCVAQTVLAEMQVTYGQSFIAL